MPDLKKSDYSKIYNAALLNIQSERPEDISVERIKYSIQKNQTIFLDFIMRGI